jgi:uncharacterized membrane protein
VEDVAFQFHHRDSTPFAGHSGSLVEKPNLSSAVMLEGWLRCLCSNHKGIQQIEEEIERLQQLVEQVKATIHSEEELESGEPKRSVPRKYTAKKAVPKKKAVVAVQPKRRGRPKKSAEPTDA